VSQPKRPGVRFIGQEQPLPRAKSKPPQDKPASSRNPVKQGKPGGEPASPGAAAERALALISEWAPTAARLLLGVVLLWFGYHELVRPGEWTGYVPVVNASSSLAIVLVLAHGWVLLVLGVALVTGIETRLMAALAGLLLLEIVISLAASGISDTTLRDAGVLGLALALIGTTRQRLVLRG
jgi:uncharacterized membrane protein YphA (DoxX/SURF4 family)